MLFKIIRHILEKIYKIIMIIFNFTQLCTHNVSLGKGVKINGKIRIYGTGSLMIGDNVVINSHLKYNPIGGQSGCTFLLEEGATVIIGEGAGISNAAICSRERIEIGREVYIGGDCRLYDTDFHSIKREFRINEHDNDVHSRPIQIKDGAFIGASCIILKGVTIGENSVVGAGAVVACDIPDNQIWAGNPAKYIKNVPTGEQ